MTPIRDLISRELIDSLWGCGYTVVPRQTDAMYVDPKIIPEGMSYQWNVKRDLKTALSNGWKPVPSSRHEGIYAPVGYQGDVEWGGLVLMEKPKDLVDAELKSNADKAQQNIDEWVEEQTGEFSGHVKVGTSIEDAILTAVGETVESDETEIPKELVPYILEILRERDRMLSDDYSSDQKQSKKDALSAAISVIRERRKDELNVTA